MTEKDQDRDAFEQALIQGGLHVNLTRIGPASRYAGEYADVIMQTCWKVWKLAIAYRDGQIAAAGATEDGDWDEREVDVDRLPTGPLLETTTGRASDELAELEERA